MNARAVVAGQLHDMVTRLQDEGHHEAAALLKAVALGQETFELECAIPDVHGLASMLWTAATAMFMRGSDEAAGYHRELAHRMDQEYRSRTHTDPSLN